jgi:hypothetical protein
MPVITSQFANRLQVQGLYVRPEVPAHTADQTRAAAAPVIGHLNAKHRMGRNYFAHHAGDAVNAVLAAAGYNFHLLLRWLELLLTGFLAAQKSSSPSIGPKIENFTDD